MAPVANNVNNSAINKQSFTANIIGNPVQDVLKLSVNTIKSQAAHIIIIDVNGKQLAITNENLNAGSNLFSFAVKNYASGISIINIVAEDNSSTQLKFVK